MKSIAVPIVACVALWSATAAEADTFGSGPDAFQIEFVRIGNPGNSPDTTGDPNPAGSVDYEYRIGKFEIAQDIIRKANALGGLAIDYFDWGPNKPATNISVAEAARFVNWLNTSTGSVPAYKFQPNGEVWRWDPGDLGYDPDHPFRNRLARYFLPNADEWYKAAYYDPVANRYYDYPTGSDSVPDGIEFVNDTVFDALFIDGGINQAPNDVTNVGLLSPYGTAGQGGNVWEMFEDETISGFIDGIRGGYWGQDSSYLSASKMVYFYQRETVTVGLRVASIIPEPHSITLGVFALVGVCVRRRKS
jgi:hypothetical protein